MGGLAYGLWQMTALVVPAAVYLSCLAWFAVKSRVDPARRVP